MSITITPDGVNVYKGRILLFEAHGGSGLFYDYMFRLQDIYPTGDGESWMASPAEDSIVLQRLGRNREDLSQTDWSGWSARSGALIHFKGPLSSFTCNDSINLEYSMLCLLE